MNKQNPVSDALEANKLEQEALSWVNSGKYKEAIGLYKKLLHFADNKDWHLQLANCYVQRALTFSAKSMYKEAIVLWENYSQYAQPPYRAYDQYIAWLIQTKNLGKVQTGLKQLTAEQLDMHYPDLASRLGLLMLTEYPELEQALPLDSILIAHLQIARRALQAYQEKNLEVLNETLKQLPYRSAFRDFRTLLKAAIAKPGTRTQAQTMLDKIPQQSVYAQTARLLRATALNGTFLVRETENFIHRERRVLGEIKGLNKKQIELIEQLYKHRNHLTDKVQFNLAITYQSLCGSDLAQRFCHGKLTNYPAGRRDFNKNFSTLGEFEENRLKALSFEKQDNNYDADYYWKQSIKALNGEGADSQLKIALILRHIAAKQALPEETQTLIESLEYDPDDRDTYLKILGYYGQNQEAIDTYKLWLSKTIKKFPQDLDILTLTIQAAKKNKAYKKAIQQASKMLKIDPLNAFARQTLFSCHLAQARRLIQSKKHHLVETEIEQAEDLKMGKDYAFQTRLLRGYYCFASQEKKQGLQRIAETLNKQYCDPVTMHFQATMEALLSGLPVTTILRELPPVKDYVISEQVFAQLIKLIQQYVPEDDNHERLHKALGKIKAPLKKSLLEQNFGENQCLVFCQLMDDINHFELLRHASKLAQQKWQKPIWMYYRVYSETNGHPEECTYMHVFRLNAQLDQAQADNDHRAMVLIDNYLDRYHQTHADSGMGFFENLFDSDQQEDDEDPLAYLFDHLPDDILYKLNKRIESLMKKASPEQVVNDLNAAVGKNYDILSAMMQNPDLFSALMIIRAANDLKLDIEVSIEDVLDSFAVTEKNNSFPFPF